MTRPAFSPLCVTLRRAALAAAIAAATVIGATAVGSETAPIAVVAEAAAPIEGGAEICGRGECPLGILVAEAMRAHLLASGPEDAAPGAAPGTAPGAAAPAETWSETRGIVAALVPAEALGASLDEGPVTAEALDAALPSGERLVEIEVSGAALLAALEHGAATIGTATPRLLQVAGLRYAVDPAAPTGQRVGEVRLWRDAGSEFIRHGNEWNVMHRSARWIRLDPAARYRLATTQALARGEGGFSMLAGAEEMAGDRPALAEVVAAYLRATTPYAPIRDGRIAHR